MDQARAITLSFGLAKDPSVQLLTLAGLVVAASSFPTNEGQALDRPSFLAGGRVFAPHFTISWASLGR
jgi:hypothetical protein